MVKSFKRQSLTLCFVCDRTHRKIAMKSTVWKKVRDAASCKNFARSSADNASENALYTLIQHL